MRLLKKQTCRWLDSCMNCCRHPSTYERMRQLGVFAEFKCRCRKGCGYEKYDGTRPMWWDPSGVHTVLPPVPFGGSHAAVHPA